MSKTLKLGLLAFAVLGMVFLGCDKLANPIVETPEDPGKVTTSDFPHVEQIMAGQHTVAGTVTVYATSENIYVRYQTTGDWYLTEYHVHVVDECEGGYAFPNHNGNPTPGQFDYGEEFDRTREKLVEIPWGDLWGSAELCFATHCAVERDLPGGQIQTETGWSGDQEFPGDNWALYFCIEAPKVLRLPSHKVWVQYTQVSGSTPSMFHVWGVGTGYSIPDDGYHRSFCLDQTVYIYNRPYEAYLRTAFDPFLPDYIKYNRAAPNAETPYDKINYLVDLFMDNLPTYGNPAGIAAFQQVIWYYRGIGSQPVTGLAGWLYGEGEAHDGWTPEGGDWMAVMMDIGSSVQLCFIMVDP